MSDPVSRGAPLPQKHIHIEDFRSDRKKCSFFDALEKIIAISLTVFAGMLCVFVALLAKSFVAFSIGIAFFTIAGVFYFSNGMRVPPGRIKKHAILRPRSEKAASCMQPHRVKKVHFGSCSQFRRYPSN